MKHIIIDSRGLEYGRFNDLSVAQTYIEFLKKTFNPDFSLTTDEIISPPIQIEYTIEIISGTDKGRVIKNVFDIEELEEQGIVPWLVNRSYVFSMESDLKDYIKVINREILS